MGLRSVLVGVFAVTFALVVASSPAAARGHHLRVSIPTHLTVGDQTYDGSVAGLRAYLDTTKTTDPQLFAQLSPELERLEENATAAKVVLGAGAIVGLGAIVYSVAGRKTCTAPTVTDPDFAAGVQRWSACNDDNMQMSVTAGMIGMGILAAGIFGAMAIAPGRADVMSFVNRHNGLGGREPIRFQLGYDPSRRFAHSGVAFSF